MAIYYKEVIRTGINITLLITILFNNIKLLIEIIERKYNLKENNISNITIRIEKAY
jgi:hypothetical protein